MIKEFVDKYMDRKAELEKLFADEHPTDYLDVVRSVVKILHDEDTFDEDPSPECIHQIDDGDYQGTLVFVIGNSGYQPGTYWYVRVSYGSCSGCDTLVGIKSVSPYDEKPNEQQIKDYMTLALHIVQGLKRMEGDVV